MHKELYLIKGLPASPGDAITIGSNPRSTSQEQGQQVIALMGTTSFTLKTNGWNPQIAQFSGTWKESNLTDGRELIAGKNQNVIENMQLELATATHQELYESLKVLNRLAEDAELFHTSNYQFEPVYIKWWAECGKGYQYALIYNIDIVPALVDLNQTPTIDIALTIEREPYWRPLPPGMSSRLWSAYWETGDENRTDFDDYDYIDTAVYNFTSLAANSLNIGEDACTKAYVDIAAGDIPGDAPALIQIDYDGFYPPSGNTAGILTKLMIGRYTRPLSYVYAANASLDGQYLHTNTLQTNPDNAGTMEPYGITLGTNAATAADTGARGRKATCASSAVKNRVDVSYGTATDATRLTWALDPTAMAGRYAVFLRGGQRGGSLGDQSIYLTYGYGGDDKQTDPVAPSLTAASPSEFWGVTYMGTVEFPTDNRKVGISTVSYGIRTTTAQIFLLRLQAARSTGTSTLYIQDVVLMPIDEAALTIDFGEFTDPFTSSGVYDNTGYSLHGGTGDAAYSSVATPQLLGTSMTLRPGVTNRLYFYHESYPYLGTFATGQSSIVADPGTGSEVEVTLRIRVNLLPRWLGVRDA